MARASIDSLSISFTRDINCVVVRVGGEVDIATAPLLQQALVGVIDEQGNLSVRLDLRGLDFIDSSGLSVLVRAQATLRDKGGDMTVDHPQPAVRRLFEISGFDRIVTITPAPPAAWAGWRQATPG